MKIMAAINENVEMGEAGAKLAAAGVRENGEENGEIRCRKAWQWRNHVSAKNSNGDRNGSYQQQAAEI